MTTLREAAQMALDALEHGLPIIEDFGGKEQLQLQHKAISVLYEALRAALAQPEQEPVAWIGFNERGECREVFTRDMKKLWPNYLIQDMTPLYTAPPHFLDPAKVARLIDEAFERGKKEVDMEQVKDIAQKLADCALLNSAPPQREWQGLTEDDFIGLTTPQIFAMKFAEAKLKEKNGL